MIRATISGLIFGMCCIALSSADAAYVIKLKNGNEYVTTRYWHERGQVLFDTYDGVFGIDKSFVTKIQNTSQVVRLANDVKTESGEKSRGDGPQNDKESEEQKPSSKTGAERKREAGDPIVGEFNRLKQKSNEVEGMLTSEIRDLLKEIKAFKDKISGNSKLFIDYAREFNDVHEISSAVEATLQSRR